MLDSFGDNLRCAVIGASGGIGRAFTEQLAASDQVETIYALSRQGAVQNADKVKALPFDLTDEASIERTAAHIKADGPLDMVIIATGLLHGVDIAPEKNMRAMQFENYAQSFAINAIGPAMTARYFLPLMRRERKAVFAALSARVGSISDNRLGGWYAYRASKAALNMILKTLAIEYGRRFKETIIIGLHPGTVDTNLSEPFQKNVPEGKLFTPEYSAEKLLGVIDQVSSQDNGNLLDWAGKTIQP